MYEITDKHVVAIAKHLLETHKSVHGFGFEGHFISLIPTTKYLYISYRHRSDPGNHRLFKFLVKRECGYTVDEAKQVLMEIRKEYGHDHDNAEYDSDYQEVFEYLIEKPIEGFIITAD